MADAAVKQITRGAIAAIFTDQDAARSRFPIPILQCLQVKPLGNQQNGAQQGGGASDRYRVVLSDMDHYVQTMLATQANHVVHDGKLVRGSVVRIKAFQANIVKAKNILIILDLEVIEPLGSLDKLGEPVPYDTTVSAAAPPANNGAIGGTGFYGQVKKEENAKLNVGGGGIGGSIGGGGGSGFGGGDDPMHPNIYPIDGLSLLSHKWTIKARVTNKSDIRTWHKASGDGKLFSVNLLDESGEIKATAFNDQCDQYYDLLQEGCVYYISSPCRIQLAKKQFTNLRNDYELTFERDTQVERAKDQASVPQLRCDFCNIQSLQTVEPGATVDVIGIVQDVGEVSTITAKSTGKPYEKREVTLVDDSGYSVRTTLWGKTATSFDAKPEAVVAFKGLRVSDFGGRSLSLQHSGMMLVEPDITETHRLKGWYDSAGRAEQFATHNGLAGGGSLSGRAEVVKTIAQVRDENLGMDEPAYFNLKATIVFIKQEPFAYPGCITKDCNKKVSDNGDGTWRCEKCDVNHTETNYRYTLMLNVNDYTGQLWLTCFDDVGRLIMGGKTASELTRLRDEDDNAFAAAFEQANCRQFSFRARAKLDTFGDAQRIRYQIMSGTAIDFRSEGHKLAEMIKQFDLN